MKWSEKYRIPFHDTDPNGYLRPSAALKYMQEAAYLQFENLHPSMDEIRERGDAFILSRIALSFYKPLRAFEKITAQSWVCESKGLSFNRCYRILSEDNIVAEGTSVWGLLHMSDHKLIRVEDSMCNFEPDPPVELDIPKRIKFPSDIELKLVGERTVMYSDIDYNGHMNNTHYPDMLCDYIPDMRERRVIAMSVNFVGEAPLGESVRVYCAQSDDTYYFRTLRENNTTNVEAEIVVEGA